MQTENFSNIPKSWQIKTLGEVCELCNGYAFKSSSFINNGVPVVRIGDIKNFEIDVSNAMQVEISQKYENYQIQNGDLLIAMSGVTTGKMGIYKLKNPAYLNQRVGNLKIKSDEIIPEYRNFALYALQTEIYKRAYGGAQPNISKGAIESLKIPLPPLDIQKRIVARLDEAFARIDNGTKHLKSAKANLAKYKQSLLKSAFEGTLTDTLPHPKPLPQGEGLTFDSPSLADSALSCPHSLVEDNFTHSTSLAKCRPTISPSLAEGVRGWVDSHNSETPNLPQGWTIKTLGEIGEIITGSTPNTKNKEYYDDEYPFYKPTDLNLGYFVENSSDMVSAKGFEISRKLPPKSILVTCIGATIGKTGFIRKGGICNQQINAIIPKQSICPEFVYFYCISNKMQELIKTNASATTLPILNKTAFSKLPIPLPPLQTQKQIVEILEKHFSSADKTSAFIDSALKNAKQLKSSLLKSAFMGKLI